MISKFLKRSNTIVGLVRGARKTRNVIRRRGIIKTYLASHTVRKLQLGSGPTSLPGWLASDINAEAGRIYLDATKPFPFKDGTLDYIYSEHMIEHISWDDGKFMLRECQRVLKPGGTIRIVTPDLRVLLGLYNGGPSNERYIQWITDKCLNKANGYRACFVINNAFRNWGHQFLYDTEVLAWALSEAGFEEIKQCSFGKSDDENLEGVESHGQNIGAHEIAVFESMIFEAKRAAASGRAAVAA